MADIIPHDLIRAMANKEVDLDTDTIKVALFTSSATVGADVVGLSDLGANQVANGNGYTTGGVAVTPSLADQDGSDNVKYDISDPSWTASGGSIGPFRYAVVYDDTHASDQIIYIIDLGTNVTISSGASFSIVIDSNGLFTGAQA
jgi:hypothetical protein